MDRDIFNKRKNQDEENSDKINSFGDYIKQKEKKLRIQAQKLY